MIIKIMLFCPECKDYLEFDYDISAGVENKTKCSKCNKTYEVDFDDHPEGGFYYWISKEIQ